MGDWFVPVAQAPLVVVFNKCQLAGPFYEATSVNVHDPQALEAARGQLRCVTYNSTTVPKSIDRDFSLLGTRHQVSAIGARSSNLSSGKGRDKRSA